MPSVSLSASEALANFEAVHLGHEDVQQDEIGVMAEGQIQRALSVLGDDEEIVLFEGLDQDVQIDGIVIPTRTTGLLGCIGRLRAWGAAREQGRADPFQNGQSSFIVIIVHMHFQGVE